MKLSIVIPVLNEAAALPLLLEALHAWADQGCEIIIADGGSTDGTIEMVRSSIDSRVDSNVQDSMRDVGVGSCSGLTLVRAPRGRARQMNCGAAHASGDVLLFLHADTVLPDGALQAIEQALGNVDSSANNAASKRNPGSQPVCWGRFDVRITGRAPMLVVIGYMMNLRSRLSGIATGDQAMFVRRAAFDAVGAFPDLPLMEDIALSSRLRAMSRPACITLPVLTSGRRWETRGLWRTIWLMWRLRFAYWRGVPASVLANAYR
jgi:rSAM/selenodomain-associated transferase 2